MVLDQLFQLWGGDHFATVRTTQIFQRVMTLLDVELVLPQVAMLRMLASPIKRIVRVQRVLWQHTSVLPGPMIFPAVLVLRHDRFSHSLICFLGSILFRQSFWNHSPKTTKDNGEHLVGQPVEHKDLKATVVVSDYPQKPVEYKYLHTHTQRRPLHVYSLYMVITTNTITCAWNSGIHRYSIILCVHGVISPNTLI